MEFPNPFNLATYFLDHNLNSRAEKSAVLFRDKSYSYRQVYEAACRFAHAARSLGVRQEDRVLVMLTDCPPFVTAVMGIHKLGAVLTMVNPCLPHEDLAYYFNYTRAPLAVIDASLVEPVDRMLPGLRYLRNILVVSNAEAPAKPGGAARLAGLPVGVAATSLPRGFLSFADVLAEQPADFDNAPTHPNDPAVWLFTSGTSGKPKAAMHLQHDFAYNTEHYARQVLRMSESDRTLSVPKLFFGYATGTNLWFPFAVGAATCLFEEHASPEIMFENIARFRPTFLTTVPTMINKMLASPQAQTADLSCLRIGVSAGEKLPAELYQRWIERFGVEILDGIGSAEMFHIYISNRIGDVKVGSLGRIVPGYEARIVDDDGRDVEDGRLGTLWIRGDSMMTGYFLDPVQSRDRLRGEWLNTCDMFRRDAEGYFWYEGRADDLLKVGGIFVSPGEIENCLLQHPAVRECAVIGAEDSAGLVRPRAFVVAAPGVKTGDALSSEIIAFAKERMAHYKAPTWIVYLDALPRNDRGKVERKKLAQL